MTALAGLWRFGGAPAAEDCERMLGAQEMYGPHAGAHWSGGEIALGRRLMRSLPEDAFDRQPLIGGGGRFVLVADLRLDNREELTEALGIPAASAAGLSDAAILLAAIERWDETCLEHLVGDYAFALWDDERRRLVLARDPLGQRPLHYHRGNGFFAFASMPKGLHALTGVPYAPDEERIAEFLVLLPETGTRTFFHGIERVEPGHVATVTPSDLAARRHWQPSRAVLRLRDPEDYVERLRALLDQAVRCRLRGAPNVAVALSGGLDSPAVAATAARLLAPSGGRVIAFTAVPREDFDGSKWPGRITDEAPLAAATAAMYPNIEHVLIRSPGRSPLDDLDRSFLLFQSPIQNICNIGWVNSINDATRERKLTVLLSGSTGNAGLSYDGMALLPELLRKGRWIQWWRAARALVARQDMRWPYLMTQTVGPWVPGALWLWLMRVRRGRNLDVSGYSAIHPRRLREIDLHRRARASDTDRAFRPAKDGFSERLWGLHSADPGNYYKGTLGGWQIDLRDPAADVRLLEFCLAVPMDQFLRDGVPRSLARRALADRVPKLVIDERRSGLQAADWHERLTAVRDGVGTELDRLAACPPAARALDLPRLRRMVEAWPASGWERQDINASYRTVLLRAISTGHFLRRATGGNQ